MSAQPLFFEQVVPLDKQRHRAWRLRADGGFGFAAKANAVPVTLPEVEKAAVEYPVVFLDEGQGAFPVAILGLQPRQNLLVGGDGRWQGRYVPAYVRTYPFILARAAAKSAGGAESFTVCLDAAYRGFNETEGERLFEEDGRQSPFLARAVAFLREYQVHRDKTNDASKELQDSGLLQPMQANIELSNGKKLSLAGFQTIDRNKFAALGEAETHRLSRSGALGMVYLHFASLNLFDALMARLTGRVEGSTGTERASGASN